MHAITTNFSPNIHVNLITFTYTNSIQKKGGYSLPIGQTCTLQPILLAYSPGGQPLTIAQKKYNAIMIVMTLKFQEKKID